MTPSQSALNRFFVCPEYSVFYRRVKKLHWENQTTSEYALLTLLAGDLNFRSDTRQGRLVATQSLMLEPNCNIAGSSDFVEFLFLVFRSSLLDQHAVDMKLTPPRSTVTFSKDPVATHPKLRSVLNSLLSELISEQAGKEIVMRALVDQVLVGILRSYAQVRQSDELEFSRVGLIDRRIRRSVELMHTQLDQELPLRELAAASYLSPFHFARLFKKITGASPHNYLAAIRTNRAQLLLADADLSVTEVAARVGYLSASHFTKAFRLATGTTPREFRKALVNR